MKTRVGMDLAGALGCAGFSAVLGFNQVVVKITNGGFSPVFAAGLRSLLALAVLALWMGWRGWKSPGTARATPGLLLLGALFSAEFLCLFLALDRTTVSRASILLYCMPVWLALTAHLWLPDERLSLPRALGLGLAVAGVCWTLYDPASRNAGDWTGDLLALVASFCWTGIALTLRLSRASEVTPEWQLTAQLGISALVLTAVAPLFGPLLRTPGALEFAALGFQGILVAGLGFLFWLFLMKRYRASDVAAFSFLSPVLAVGFGWALLDEPVGPAFLGALSLVAVGILLVNRR
ncbi:DMT family transporter [Salipiger sp.]|uniref:DMT family transporter n=1 Tax=Salipiger sp. TaxID=2078585 RepID=UPI003A9823A4